MTKRAIAPKTAFMGARVSSVSNGSKVEMSRWKGMDTDISDDQQDITRGRGMVDEKFQGAAGIGGTHVSVSSERRDARVSFRFFSFRIRFVVIDRSY